MTPLTIVGGVYHEDCIWPEWNQVYGSAGRAAAAVVGHVDEINLRTYSRPDTAQYFAQYASLYGFKFEPIESDQTISFEYIHCLSNPKICPSIQNIQKNDPIAISADLILRFGMLEGSAIVTAEHCVYDPQSAFDPELFAANGSMAAHLAIVANRSEIVGMSGLSDAIAGAQALLDNGAEVVVVKSGASGAFVVERSGVTRVPAYQSSRVWTVGSGDVFAAIFSARWAVHSDSPIEAATWTSKAVAAYAESMALPIPTLESLRSEPRREAAIVPGRAYLASPFFTIGQRWLVDEVRRGLKELGIDVFSPIHDVGAGPADVVGPADLDGIGKCDRIFAVLDGLDSGTLFEVGYARAKGLPVYALAQSVPGEDLKMITGSDCRIFDDLVTALHHTVWLT